MGGKNQKVLCLADRVVLLLTSSSDIGIMVSFGLSKIPFVIVGCLQALISVIQSCSGVCTPSTVAWCERHAP